MVDIGLEGKLLGAAFASATTALATRSALMGLMAGMRPLLFALLHGFACITQRGNQIVTGVAINVLVGGMTALLRARLVQSGGRTPSLEGAARSTRSSCPSRMRLRASPSSGLLCRGGPGHALPSISRFSRCRTPGSCLYRTALGQRIRAVEAKTLREGRLLGDLLSGFFAHRADAQAQRVAIEQEPVIGTARNASIDRQGMARDHSA